MFGRGTYTPLVQLLNPTSTFIGNDKTLFVLNALRDIHALVIHNIKLSRKRHSDKFLENYIPEFNVGDKVLVRIHTRVIWDL